MAQSNILEFDPIVILGFDPKTDKKDAFVFEITPEIAKYILDHHNKDNRKIKRGQINALNRSIENEGYFFDGDALRFNTDGNLTEGQHRLTLIVQKKITTKVVIVTGVEPDSFTKGAPARPRTAGDEIQRKYPDALASQITALAELVRRRYQGADSKLTPANAIYYWKLYSEYVKAGTMLIDEFFDNTTQYSPYRRNFAAWAALMIMQDSDETASNLLSIIEDHILHDKKTALSKDFYEFFANHSWPMSNAGRATFMYQLLCVASDRILKNSTGNIQLGVNVAHFNHNHLVQKGFYRKFLAHVPLTLHF